MKIRFRSTNRTNLAFALLTFLFVSVFLTPVRAQTPSEEEELMEPSRPDVARSAEFQKSGVLQVEYGADANFRSEDYRSEITLPLTLRFAASRRLLFDLDFDTLISQTREGEGRSSGVGDARLGLQVLALEDTDEHPALAFAYFVKVPSASREKELGTNRVDHRAIVILSKKFGKMDFDANFAYLLVGREDSDRRASGGQAALSVTRELTDRFDFIAEVSGQSEEFERPRGIYPLAAIAFKANERVQLDFGARFGIGAEAPRAGVFAGITVGVADFFKR